MSVSFGFILGGIVFTKRKQHILVNTKGGSVSRRFGAQRKTNWRRRAYSAWSWFLWAALEALNGARTLREVGGFSDRGLLFRALILATLTIPLRHSSRGWAVIARVVTKVHLGNVRPDLRELRNGLTKCLCTKPEGRIADSSNS